MRLDATLTRQAIEIVRRHFGAQTIIKLFGSRVDDAKRGGDVDLYVEVAHPVALMDEVRCRTELSDLFDLDVDLVVNDGRDDKPIYRIADRTGVSLSA